MSRDREQRRARHALEGVLSIKQETNIERKKSYRGYAESLGAAIVMNGLGQALAAERAAARDKPTKPGEVAHMRLFENVSKWLAETVYEGKTDILNAIVEGEQDAYLQAQAEALAWLVWHKKFCQAYLPPGERGSG